jgi:hypothetical protein
MPYRAETTSQRARILFAVTPIPLYPALRYGRLILTAPVIALIGVASALLSESMVSPWLAEAKLRPQQNALAKLAFEVRGMRETGDRPPRRRGLMLG